MPNQIDTKETRKIQNRYNRIAPIYDRMQSLHERRLVGWREKSWQLVNGPDILEVGVGTGRNIQYYPATAHVTAIDFSENMLTRARQFAQKLGRDVMLCQMDAQNLEFEDDTFDSAIASCVFCSIPDPVLGLQELKRVVRPGGKIILLEHMRAANPILGKIMDILDPLIVRIMGPHINRNTLDNIRQAGLMLEQVEEIDGFGIFKLITAKA